jgi:hypothetical protein
MAMNQFGMRPGIILLREGTDTSQVCTTLYDVYYTRSRIMTVVIRHCSVIALVHSFDHS